MLKKGDSVKLTADMLAMEYASGVSVPRDVGVVVDDCGTVVLGAFYNTVCVEWNNGEISHTNRKWLEPVPSSKKESK